jgi:hypothetical protein
VKPLQKKPVYVGQDAAATCAGLDEDRARAALTQFPRTEISDDELEQHIDDLAWSWRTAYARFEEHGIAADRDEALILLQLHNRAVLSRSPAAQAARWAEIERAVDEQCNYFGMRGREDRASMGRGA